MGWGQDGRNTTDMDARVSQSASQPAQGNRIGPQDGQTTQLVRGDAVQERRKFVRKCSESSAMGTPSAHSLSTLHCDLSSGVTADAALYRIKTEG